MNEWIQALHYRSTQGCAMSDWIDCNFWAGHLPKHERSMNVLELSNIVISLAYIYHMLFYVSSEHNTKSIVQYVIQLYLSDVYMNVFRYCYCWKNGMINVQALSTIYSVQVYRMNCVCYSCEYIHINVQLRSFRWKTFWDLVIRMIQVHSYVWRFIHLSTVCLQI